ncbi:MAG: redoxin domain-containing protein [Thermoleophilaceae bacterium]|nr:redoxin domain-containing protein [Thermoleophilaceae bacterium]
MIEAGRSAPEFTLPDQDGNEVSLSNYRGKTVVLVFYPLDFSPACTAQLNVYQEVLSELNEQGTDLLGISVDSAFAHKAFQHHLGATIPLLSDFQPRGAVAQRYGVFIEGRGHNERALVMVGPDGEVLWAHKSSTPLEIPGANLIFDALDQQRAA